MSNDQTTVFGEGVVTHASAARRWMDRSYAERLARDDGEVSAGGTLVRSSHRLRDTEGMTGSPAKVLFATLTECVCACGTTYLRRWAGASNLIALRGEDDDQGRPTWSQFLPRGNPATDPRRLPAAHQSAMKGRVAVLHPPTPPSPLAAPSAPSNANGPSDKRG
jgi:hypothetical protein